MHTVPATPDEVTTMTDYRDAQQQNLKETSLFAFRERRYWRDKIAEINSYIDGATVIEREFTVPGFKQRPSSWDATKTCYYTEINGLICEIDEVVHQDYLRVESKLSSTLKIRECPDGEVCTSVIISTDIDSIENISARLSDNAPARSVFPGTFDSIIEDI